MSSLETSSNAVTFNRLMQEMLGELQEEWHEKDTKTLDNPLENHSSFSSISSVKTQNTNDSFLVQDQVMGTVKQLNPLGEIQDNLGKIQLNKDLLSPTKKTDSGKRNIYDRIRQVSDSHTSEPSIHSMDTENGKRVKLQDLFANPPAEQTGRVVYPGGKRKSRIISPDEQQIANNFRAFIQDSTENPFNDLLSRLDQLEDQFSPSKDSPIRPFARESISSKLPTTTNTPEDKPILRKPVQEHSHYSFDDTVPIYQVDTLSKPPVKRLNQLKNDDTPRPLQDTPIRVAKATDNATESVKNLEDALNSLQNLKQTLENQVDTMAQVIGEPIDASFEIVNDSNREEIAESVVEEPVISISRRLIDAAIRETGEIPKKISSLNLSRLGLETLIGLDESCPNLENLNLGRNKVEFLVGCPSRVLTNLKLKHNLISTLTSFTGFDMLQTLDLSFNPELNDVSALSSLSRLTSLDLSGCEAIRDLSPLLQLESLIRVNYVCNNGHLKRLIVGGNWQWVHVSGCLLSTIEWNPSSNYSLIGLNLERNSVESFALPSGFTFQGLKMLCLGNNRLSRAPDCDRMPQLRHLDLSNNDIVDISGLRVSNRTGGDVDQGLRGPMLLQQLILAGNQLHDLSGIMKVLKRLLRLEFLDMRYNPLTIRFYPRMSDDWITADDEFKHALSDGDYVRRALYRAVVIRALKPDSLCSLPGLQMLDGVPVTKRERKKSERVLEKLKLKK